MSRTWKDKARKMGGYLNRALRAKKRAAREQFEKVQSNAIKAGFQCARCFMLDCIQKGLRCQAHGGGVRREILRKAGIISDDEKES